MRQLGFQPTVEGGAPGAFGILTRLQAVYEGISPNKKERKKCKSFTRTVKKD